MGGGGVYVADTAAMTCVNCNFKANKAEVGGGIMNGLACTTTCNSCVFDGNVAKSGGGAIFNQGTLVLTDPQYLTDSDDVMEQNLWAILAGFGGVVLCCCYFCKSSTPARAAVPPQQEMSAAPLNQQPFQQP